MMNSKDESISKLTELLNDKFNKMEEVYAASLKQGEAIIEEDVDRLNHFIEEKQKLIEEINKMDDMFMKEYSNLKNILGFRDEEDMGTKKISGFDILQKTTDKIIKKLREIQQIEENNQEKAGELLKLLGGEIRKANKEKIARLAYKNNRAYKKPPSYFIDKKK